MFDLGLNIVATNQASDELFLENLLNLNLLLSLALTLLLLLIRAGALKLIRSKSEILSEEQLRWTSRVKNLVIFLIVIVWIILWWQELRQFALSIAAIAVAIVIASKELILCISGSILRTTSGTIAVGDWVEIGDHKGEIVEQNLLSTVLQEINSSSNSYNYTGRTIILPNSVFLSQPVKDLHFMRHFVFHNFTIYTQPDTNVFEARQLILDRLDIYCADFAELGRRYHALIVKRSGMAIPEPGYDVRITTTNLAKNSFAISVFCPTKQAAKLEQQITEDFFNYYYRKKLEDNQLNNSVKDD